MRFIAVCASTAQHSLLYWAWCALFYYERIKLSSCSVAQSVICSVAQFTESRNRVAVSYR